MDETTQPETAGAGRWQRIAARIDAYERLVRLDKPIGTLLLLWPTLTALWLATLGTPSWIGVGIFVLGTLLMRSAGCAVNDYSDRDYDAHVKRTANRPLARGEIAPWEAIAVAAALALCAFLLILPLNRTTILLSLPALAITVAYPFFKRFFALPQAFLGIAFSFGVPMAFASAYGTVTSLGWVLFAANLFWVMAYDTEYAMVDRDDDIKLGLNTSAITFGRYDVLMVMLCYAVYIAALTWIGREMQLGPWFYAGLCVASLIALWHYVLIRNRDRDRCFRAFLGNHWLGLAVFAGVVADYWLRLGRLPQWPQ
ncbi:MAG: 4-hydroxybenzoate octaprenyltransferase [Betaproteobacteria bacterium]|nr:MAG: 4-hydroxybenzoate octaprenyltransferase [Betaproteobacteria bacterium]